MTLAPPSADDAASPTVVIPGPASPPASPKGPMALAAAAPAADPALSVLVGSFNTTERTRYVSGTIAIFQDTDPHGPALQGYDALIDWGDGTAPLAEFIGWAPGGVGTVGGSHAFAEEGTYTVRVTVTDMGSSTGGSGSMAGDTGGATAAGTGTATVADGALRVAARPFNMRGRVPSPTSPSPPSPTTPAPS